MRITKKDEKDQSSTSPCAHLRAAYHNCFNRWYSEKFVKGQWGKEECVSEWQKYRACLSVSSISLTYFLFHILIVQSL
ncbi:TP53-REGULATED INHIBITOR OF APOPTOSIS 1 [Salix purpurea]|uniref:TP53-REGULATED INHIBITOR OF APOPTOSIS 1 n=1 Tax=Salix purpurea TaxID=77065 RepID=A0A9Q0Q193_SALPP|nr:TP53-REGULATED INHIBITOR OF APOPTOSIS 1 [Salix purpurea]